MLFKGKRCPSCKTQETSLLVSSTLLTSPPPGQGPCTSDFFQRLIHFTMSYRCQVFPKQFWLKAFDAYWTRMWKRNAERGVGWEKERWWPRLWDSSTGTHGPPTKHTFTCCCSVAKSRLTLWPHGLQHVRLPCPSRSLWVCSNSRPLSRWCHPTISFSVSPFSCPRSFPASGSFPMSHIR